ncbi:MAG TPA: 50S ribosomal protein L11 methyltransferase [Flavobacterium sp.]|nr:50S ribosomal protein L11 methyltransferase [Flavobacterium sp.]
MSNQYIAYHFTVASKTNVADSFAKQIGSEILLAELEDSAFESYLETEEGISAYVQKELWSNTILEGVSILDNDEFSISFTVEEINQINWNEEWEKNFDPIDVDCICHVRAPFHHETTALFDIVIEPKMSFGTGHHETTHMMIQHLLETDVTLLKTLDMGCGTAILAILAEMKGAQPIDAIDIDNWCYLNSIENVARNNCSQITVYQGDASLLNNKKYDLILANINRNILLNDMKQYVESLNKNGIIIFSGFYTQDVEVINELCQKHGLSFVKKFEKNNWVSLKYLN